MRAAFTRVKGEFDVARAAIRRQPEGMHPGEVMVGWTTTASREEADRLAHGLVEERLAACAQVSGPITSVYRWEGRVEQATEFRVAVKFLADRVDAIAEWLAQHHSYAVPQWICCRAAAGSEKYLNWAVENST